MKNALPTALAIPLLALASAAYAGPDTASVHRAAISAPGAKPVARTAQPRTALPEHARKLDLSAPNFASARWQRRLQGPTIDHSLEYMPMESVVVTPGEDHLPNTSVAPAGLGSVYWAMMHPAQSWRVLMPVQPGDEFNADREIALAYNDPQSDCPGFPGTPNVRPICN
jgi:hypothetical protein